MTTSLQMSKFKAYIACPMSIPMSRVMTCKELLFSLGVDEVAYWPRGYHYTTEPLRTSNALVVLLPDNKFELEVEKIPQGTKSEINLALNLDIPIYLGYIAKMTGELTIYNAVVHWGRIKGVAGQTNLIAMNHRHGAKKVEEPIPKVACKVGSDLFLPGTKGECFNLTLAAEAFGLKPVNILVELQELHAKLAPISKINLQKVDKRVLIQML